MYPSTRIVVRLLSKALLAHVWGGVLRKRLQRSILYHPGNNISSSTPTLAQRGPLQDRRRKTEPLEAYFRSYSFFVYDPVEPASQQFRRLCKEAGWVPPPPSKPEKQIAIKAEEDALEGYKSALVKQFNVSFGTDDDDLSSWHGLLLRVGIKNLPDSVKGCKKIIDSVHVNLVDLVDARGDPKKEVQRFGSELELSKYTIMTEKYFPKEDAHAGNLLKYLLRKILAPPPEGLKGDRACRARRSHK